jgi:hypothetical protein
MAQLSTAAMSTRTVTMRETRTVTGEAASITQNNIIATIPVSKGDVVLDVVVHYDNLGANTAIIVGDGNVTNRFITSTATTSAGRTSMNSAADVGPLFIYPADDTIDLVQSGSGTATTTYTMIVDILRTVS